MLNGGPRDVSQKQSGLEWLGKKDVGEMHRSVARLKYQIIFGAKPNPCRRPQLA